MKINRISRVAASFALAGTMLFCASACAVNSGKINDAPKDIKLSAYSITALDGYTPTSVDKFGIILAENNERYALYSTHTGLLYTENFPFTKLTDGLYVVEKGEQFLFYGRTGLCATLNGEAYSGDNPYYSSNGKTMIYVRPDGAVISKEKTLDPVLTESDAVFPLEGYALQRESTSPLVHSVFDKAGNFLRTISLENLLGVPLTDDPVPVWCLRNKIYTQYSVPVADSEKDFDYYTVALGGVAKMKLVTKSYDVGSGKIAEYDANYIIEPGAQNVFYPPYAEHYVFLKSIPIVERQVGAGPSLLQCFNESVGLYTDVQKLMPGADSVFYDGDHIVFCISSSSDNPVAVYGKGSLLSVTYGKTYLGSGLMQFGGDFYAPDGSLLLFDGANQQFYTTGRTLSGTSLLYYTYQTDNTTYLSMFSVDGEEHSSAGSELFIGGNADTAANRIDCYCVTRNEESGIYTVKNAYFNYTIFSGAGYGGNVSEFSCRTDTGFYQVFFFTENGTPKTVLFRANNLPRSNSASRV